MKGMHDKDWPDRTDLVGLKFLLEVGLVKGFFWEIPSGDDYNVLLVAFQPFDEPSSNAWGLDAYGIRVTTVANISSLPDQTCS